MAQSIYGMMPLDGKSRIKEQAVSFFDVDSTTGRMSNFELNSNPSNLGDWPNQYLNGAVHKLHDPSEEVVTLSSGTVPGHPDYFVSEGYFGTAALDNKSPQWISGRIMAQSRSNGTFSLFNATNLYVSRVVDPTTRRETTWVYLGGNVGPRVTLARTRRAVLDMSSVRSITEAGLGPWDVEEEKHETNGTISTVAKITVYKDV